MNAYPESISQFRKTLEIAAKYEAVPMILETLVRVAEFLDNCDECERAAEVIALTLCYPLRKSLRQRAERLFTDLETRLCPQAIEDAKTLTDVLTLDDMVEMILVSTT